MTRFSVSYLRPSVFISGLILFLAATLSAAVDGTVTNKSTGKPQPNVIISLVQPGQGGMQTLGTVKTDAEGKFKFDKSTGENPALLQAIYAGVTYTKMVAPGTPPTGIAIEVFNATADPAAAQMNQHAIVLEPGEKGLHVSEIYLMRNTGKFTYNDPAKGTLRFFLTPGHSDVRVTISAPGGMPVEREATPAGPANTFKVDYPIRPGETRFDLNYTTDTSEYSGKTLLKGGETRLVVPNGVTLTGEGLEQIGTEPKTQAKIFAVKTETYSVKVSGTGSMAADTGASADSGDAKEDNGQPQIKESRPRIYGQLYLVLGLAGAILALGFIVLYRSRA